MPDEGLLKSHSAEVKERKNFRIIFAEDLEDVRTALKMTLDFLGYVVVSVPSGDELIKKLLESNQTFDLIITDYHMPGKTGLEAIEMLRSMGNKTPIIILTARPDLVTPDIQKIIGVACLGKPATLQQIEDAVEKIRLESKNKLP
jgi:CheY-like chemotaxis protein